MRKRLWDLAKSRIEIGTILPGHRHKVAALVQDQLGLRAPREARGVPPVSTLLHASVGTCPCFTHTTFVQRLRDKVETCDMCLRTISFSRAAHNTGRTPGETIGEFLPRAA